MNSFFWDTHAHIFSEYYDDIELILSKSKENNIKYILNSGVNNCTNKEVIKLSKQYKNLFCTIGIHPEEFNNYVPEDLIFIEKNIMNKKVLGIGEIGLDYHYEIYDKKQQIILFEKQLLLAEKYKIPVIIHSRDATKDTIDILKQYKVKGIIHSFSGSLETAIQYINMGFLLGINGIVTFKNCKMKDVYSKIDISNIVLETDSPYLSPVPFRGKQNDPSKIINIAEFLSTIYDLPIDKIAEITTTNFLRIFDKV